MQLGLFGHQWIGSNFCSLDSVTASSAVGQNPAEAKWPDHGVMEPFQPYKLQEAISKIWGEVIRGLGTNHHNSNWHELSAELVTAWRPGIGARRDL
ncbi:hypothetical protein GX51_01322 [Blastomyces parvus]|uniref:Uncharacterized protein n=1 Tax=Blastomyces parvus TaxID=2060905 RepID=A0A2B7XHR6_9EURO|nr:hypothetical protein GX51_01322 [Blastomyces parvus]